MSYLFNESTYSHNNMLDLDVLNKLVEEKIIKIV